MKEKFLNIFIFLISLAFIFLGVVLMFFNNLDFIKIVHQNAKMIFIDTNLSNFFIQFCGSFIFAWGIFFFLLTVFAVMDLKTTNIYAYIFWGFTFWAVSAGIVAYLHKYYSLLIGISILYGALFIPFFLSLAMKSGKSVDKQ